MKDEEYFDYLMQQFHEEHGLEIIILIGKDRAVRLLECDPNE